MKRAVSSGYWHLYRYNPLLAQEGKNPFIMDSKPPTESIRDFLHGEVRYTMLQQAFPQAAERLFAEAERDAKRRLEAYGRLGADNALAAPKG
jgi:pyruvate-ferredoxin/flavodoxin oxidoreductase